MQWKEWYEQSSGLGKFAWHMIVKGDELSETACIKARGKDVGIIKILDDGIF